MSFHPNTPQSDSQFSPSTTELPLASTTSNPTSKPHSLPTPAHSVNGSMASQPSDMSQDMALSGGEESPQKRKRSMDDLGEREAKKVHIEKRSPEFEVLHMNVGPKYLLCKTPHPVTRPRTSDDLFDVFNLTDIAASVARTLPNGEKNAIRKTYKGHIKKLGVTGHFDAVKKESTDKYSFMNIVQMPDQEWNVHFVKGKEVERGLSNPVTAKLVRAMTMVKGTVPKQEWDSSVLGELAPSNITTQKPSSAKATAPSTPAAAVAVGTPTNVPRPAKAAGPPMAQSQAHAQAQEAARPKRNIKKRSYGDSSYEGYGEGYIDDELEGAVDMDGYETGEGMDGGVKRRKKMHPNPQTFATGPVRQQSYGPGMVGA